MSICSTSCRNSILNCLQWVLSCCRELLYFYCSMNPVTSSSVRSTLQSGSSASLQWSEREEEDLQVLIKGSCFTPSRLHGVYCCRWLPALQTLVMLRAGCGLNVEVRRIHFNFELFLVPASLGSSSSLSWTQVTRNSEQHLQSGLWTVHLPPLSRTLTPRLHSSQILFLCALSEYELFSLLLVRQSQCVRQDGVATSLDTAFHRLNSHMANHPITWQHLNVFRYVGSHEVIKCFLVPGDLFTKLLICWRFHAEPSLQLIEWFEWRDIQFVAVVWRKMPRWCGGSEVRMSRANWRPQKCSRRTTSSNQGLPNSTTTPMCSFNLEAV